MPIERGLEWGSDQPLPPGAVEVGDDASLCAAVHAGATHVRPTAGDLARTIGVSAGSLARPAQVCLVIDMIEVTLDDRPPRLAVAHVIVGPAFRPQVAIMNAAFVDRHNVAPRAHPGDGQLDVVSFRLGLVDWIKARQRMPSGTHVPHPGIETRRATIWEPTTASARPLRVAIDGVTIGRFSEIRCEVVPSRVVVGV